jgi:predicted heme/steroid binding protein
MPVFPKCLKLALPLYRTLKVTFLAEELRQFTSKELEEYNGKNGKPAYIAYQGKVYDISQSSLWGGGEHMGMHQAGKDLTEELELAPHGEEVLERAKLIGVLV